MDDMNAFERQLSVEVAGLMGPVRPVDDFAIFSAVSSTHSPKRSFQPLFSATKFVVAIVALFGVFLLTSVLTTQPSEESGPGATTDSRGTFSSAGALIETRRADHDAIPLPDGRVLVVGGSYWDREIGGERFIAAVEVWDPETATFSPAGTLDDGRDGATTTRLPDGRVLVVGGEVINDDHGYLEADAQVCDPETESFHAAGPLDQARWGHSATLLPDGRVLIVVGWRDGGPITAAEVWDSETLTFSPGGSLNDARGENTTAVLLPDGRVLVVGGGFIGGLVGTAEVWDPETATFSRAGALAEMTPAHPLAEPRAEYTATLLQDGRVLFIGGGHVLDPDRIGEFRDDPRAEIWDLASMSFGRAGSLAEGRWEHTATRLPDGRVLVIGGWRGNAEPIDHWLASAELWDPTTQTFSPAGSLIAARRGHRATLLADGRVLVVGGSGIGHSPVEPELWDPATQTFSPVGSLAEAPHADSATLLPDGRVLVIGSTGVTDADPSIATIWSP